MSDINQLDQLEKHLTQLKNLSLKLKEVNDDWVRQELLCNIFRAEVYFYMYKNNLTNEN